MKTRLSRQTIIWLICLLILAAINVWLTNKYVTVFSKSSDFEDARHPLDHPWPNNRNLDLHPPRADIHDGVLLYPQNPILFANILLECLADSKCHLMYHHIPKTAGTFFASSVYPVFEDGRVYRSMEWCCYEIIMEKTKLLVCTNKFAKLFHKLGS